MNVYLKIIIVSFLLLMFSIFNEQIIDMHHIKNTNPSVCEYFCIYGYRLFHYFVYLYSAFYLFFFNDIGSTFDVYLYLITVFIIILGWYIFESCWVSYYELLAYKIDTEKIKTNFHPTFHTIFGEYVANVMYINGILYVFTVSYVLYKTNAIPLNYKIMYYIVFWTLFLRATIFFKGKTYSAEKNNSLKVIKDFFHKFLQICNC
jgi:hypothetical protein